MNDPQQYQQAQQQQPSHYHPAKQTSGLAVTSLILSIVSLLGGFYFIFPPVLAVTFGHIALRTCKKDPTIDGKGLAIAGVVMGWISLAIILAVIAFFLLIFLIAFFTDGSSDFGTSSGAYDPVY